MWISTNKFKIDNEEEDMFKLKNQTFDDKIDDATLSFKKKY